jgi:hypothetical protein
VTRWCFGTDTLFLEGLRQRARRSTEGPEGRGDVVRDPKRELGPGGLEPSRDVTRWKSSRGASVSREIDQLSRRSRLRSAAVHGQPWAYGSAEGRGGQAQGRSPPSTGGQGAGERSLERRSPGEHRPSRGPTRRAAGTDRPGDQSPEGECRSLPAPEVRRTRPATTMAAGGVGRAEASGRAIGMNVRRARGAERRRGSAVGSKALEGEPHGRHRDETSPGGVRRSNPSGGCETLEAERTGRGKPGRAT